MTFDEQDLAAQTSLRQLKKDIQTAEPATLRLLLTEARTINTWTNQEVSVETLKEIYEIMKMGPTSTNNCPARLIFLKSPDAKERLRKALKPNNVDKTMKAP
ncbi:MAG: nitroreductase family protein, partial [Acidiferrobacteraceae bacterium]|nr:nitroreductase family protein [Acidiferrobacteraceae bacterium]